MCVLSGFNRVAIHFPYGWHQDKDAQALHWCPGIPTSTLFIISTPSTTYSHDTSVCSRSTVIRNKRYYYYYFHYYYYLFAVYLVQNRPDPLSVFTAYLIYPRISRTLRFRAVSSRRRRRSLTSGHSRTSSAASPTGRRRCLRRRRRMTMTRPTC